VRNRLSPTNISLAGIAIILTTGLSALLPDVALDTAFADAVIRLTDTASIKLLPYLLLAMIAIVISRPGISTRRRTIEAATALVTMLLVGLTLTNFNEHGIKPLFGVPRPNIADLAESGALGPEYPDGDAFYAAGDKQDRREILGELLETVETPPLSDLVREHWAHETGFSFPSGHATGAAAFATVMAAVGFAWLAGWRWVIAAVALPIWAVSIAYSRVLLDVHRPIDVVAGSLVGFLFGLTVFVIFQRTVERLAA
jgi:phosphatidylglycerophosphatase B